MGRCCQHPEATATLQCIGSKRLFCTSACFFNGWREWIKSEHLFLCSANSILLLLVSECAELLCSRSQGERAQRWGRSQVSVHGPALDRGALLSLGFSLVLRRLGIYGSSVGTCAERAAPSQVGRSRSYAPDLEDVGHFLKYECQAVDVATGQPIGPLQSLQLPQRVISAPQPLLRRLVGIVPEAERVGRFTVISYNVLADLYASVRSLQVQEAPGSRNCSGCPFSFSFWASSWVEPSFTARSWDSLRGPISIYFGACQPPHTVPRFLLSRRRSCTAIAPPGPCRGATAGRTSCESSCSTTPISCACRRRASALLAPCTRRRS